MYCKKMQPLCHRLKEDPKCHPQLKKELVQVPDPKLTPLCLTKVCGSAHETDERLATITRGMFERIKVKRSTPRTLYQLLHMLVSMQ